jgi:hypothetical protein
VGCDRVEISEVEISEVEISHVTAENSQPVRCCSAAAGGRNRGFPTFLVQTPAVFSLRRTATTARSALRVERGGRDGSGRGVRLRCSAVPTNRGAIDRARLPLPDCQKMTGSAFVLNMWIEKNCVEADHNAPKSFMLPAGSGKPHEVFFCGNCMSRLWSKYHASPGDTLLVRVGTLDHPEQVEPDVHIFTRSKLPWFELPPGKPAFEAFYKL